VTIHRIEVLSVSLPRVTLRVHCSKGTYIRTLAQDIGERLGCGAHLAGLRRESVRDLDPACALRVSQAITLGALQAMPASERLEQLLALDWLLAPLPRIDLDEVQAMRFCRGQRLRISASAPSKGVIAP
jgi:tRNA pseudouridine55 synthase